MPMRVQARIIDCDDVRGGFEGVGDRSGISAGFAGAKVKGLETTVGKPAVESGGNGANGVLKER